MRRCYHDDPIHYQKDPNLQINSEPLRISRTERQKSYNDGIYYYYPNE